MTNNEENRASFGRALLLLARLPDDCEVSFNALGPVGIFVQAHTQAEVAAIRVRFSGTFWTKRRLEDANWWEYHADVDGVHIELYACREAPPTCRAVETVVEVEEQVPVAFETRRVTKKITRWDCGGEGTSA